MTQTFSTIHRLTAQAAPARVWAALTNPVLIAQYMPGVTVAADWQPGGLVRYTGEWEGQPFEDRGVVLALEPERLLRLAFQSAGGPGESIVTYALTPAADGRVMLTITQEGLPTEAAAAAAGENWARTLSQIQQIVEGASAWA